MAGVAQLVRALVVALEVAGSSPVVRPTQNFSPFLFSVIIGAYP